MGKHPFYTETALEEPRFVPPDHSRALAEGIQHLLSDISPAEQLVALRPQPREHSEGGVQLSEAGRKMEKGLTFHTDYVYTDRETKARFVYEKYRPILTGRILDVGADQCFLKRHLPEDVEYVGIGFGDNPDIAKVDLEKESIPFSENSFDCVLCLDVLEHLENIHEMFDELCRVTRKWAIISLPNPWAVFMTCLQTGKYEADRNMKFYGLTKEREPDRHKWFFSSSEAKEFVKYRALKNNMEVYDLYVEGGERRDGLFAPKSFVQRRKVRRIIEARKLLFRTDLHFPDIYEGTQWYVLRKRGAEE